jgi:succinate dehydrogenase/fumarate reductase flavoprotein subunit
VLAGKISNPYQLQPIPARALEEAVARYNSFVDAGKDADFGKPGPKHKIQKPPFYAAWSTPILHDCLAGLRINRKCQVIDLKGQVIPGLYCCGESAGGFADEVRMNQNECSTWHSKVAQQRSSQDARAERYTASKAFSWAYVVAPCAARWPEAVRSLAARLLT